ncbi:hypothetical protein ACTG9Q_14835 [Actinokineospora sp. 24-640]
MHPTTCPRRNVLAWSGGSALPRARRGADSEQDEPGTRPALRGTPGGEPGARVGLGGAGPPRSPRPGGVLRPERSNTAAFVQVEGEEAADHLTTPLFELCRVPFFAHGPALGDVVETDTGYPREHADLGHLTLEVGVRRAAS